MEWAVVVPVKLLAVAKSRLAGLDHSDRESLALAMACDVVAAARATPGVVGVVVVTNDVRAAAELESGGARVVADASDAGLNPALGDGERVARVWWPRAGVAALSSDLPALRSEELGAALAAATAYARALVPDESGAGTTLLTATPGHDLAPAYGPSSRSRHEQGGAVVLEGAWPGLRRDVDTVNDLGSAGELGLGPSTRAALHGEPTEL